MADFSREELLAEAKRRGLDVSQYEQPEPQFSREELLAEARRRGLQVPGEEQDAFRNAHPTLAKLNDIASSPLAQKAASFGLGVGQLEHEIPVGAANLGIRGLNALGANIPLINKPTITENATNPGYAKAGEIAASLALPLPGVNKLTALTKSAGGIGRLLGMAGDSALTGAGYGALFGASDKDKSLASSTGQGAAFGGLMGGLFGGGTGIVNALARSGRRSPEEIAAISQRIGDTPVSIAEVADSPFLRKLSSITGELPFSGNRKSQVGLINSIDERASNLVNSLKGQASKDSSETTMLEEIRKNRDFHKSNSNKNYENIRKKALEVLSPDELGSNSKGIKIKPFSTANSYADAISKYGEINLPVKDFSRDIANGNIKSYSYDDFHNIQSSLRKAASSAALTGDNQTSAALTKIREGMLDDMQTSLRKSSMPQLEDQLKAARNYHRENVAPYEKSENAPIYRGVIGKNAPENVIRALIKPENTKLIEHMSPEQRNLLAYNLIKKRIETSATGADNISPSNLINTINSIPERYRELIFSPSQRQEISQIDALNHLTKDIRARVKPPKTGFALKDNVVEAAKTALGAGALHYGMGLPAAAGTTLAFGGLSNLLRRYMENPNTRQAFINQQIIEPQKPMSITDALIRAFAQQNSGGNK